MIYWICGGAYVAGGLLLWWCLCVMVAWADDMAGAR